MTSRCGGTQEILDNESVKPIFRIKPPVDIWNRKSVASKQAQKAIPYKLDITLKLRRIECQYEARF